MSTSLSWKLQDVADVFAQALDDVKSELQNAAFSNVLSQYLQDGKVEEYQEHLSNLQFEVGSRPSKHESAYYLYDHRLRRNTFVIFAPLQKAFYRHWKTFRMSRPEAETVVKMFTLHEVYHIFQRVHSERYPIFRGVNEVFVPTDYRADALAIDVLFALDPGRSSSWPNALANLIRVNLLASQAFTFIEDSTPSISSIDGRRLRRQATWAFQYARASMYDKYSPFEDFDLSRRIDVELLHKGGSNLCSASRGVSEKQLLDIERFVLYLSPSRDKTDEVIAYTPSPLVHNALLKNGILKNDFEGMVNYFRPLLDGKSYLLGTNRGKQPKKIITFAIVKNGEAPYVEEIYSGFVRELSVNESLADLGFFPSCKSVIGLPKVKDSEQNKQIIGELLKAVQKTDYSYLVPLGTEVAMVAAQAFGANRILFCGVSDPVRAGLVSYDSLTEKYKGKGNIAGVAYSIPVTETIDVLSQAFPDVGPVLRRSLTRADDFFDDLLSLTLYEKLIRGQVPE